MYNSEIFDDIEHFEQLYHSLKQNDWLVLQNGPSINIWKKSLVKIRSILKEMEKSQLRPPPSKNLPGVDFYALHPEKPNHI